MGPRILAGIALTILLGYGAWKAFPLLYGPSITLLSPAPYASQPDGYLPIHGVAERTESLTLNGGQLFIDQEGRFDKMLLLPRGGAVVTLVATDRFGRSVTVTRSVVIP